jgi:hypothetical protein
MKDVGNGTVGGVLKFLITLTDKGRLSEGQAKPLKIAITKVFSTVDGTTWEQTNIRGVDVNDYMRRFVNKTDVFYTDESLQTYKSRVARALRWYENFLDNPGWTPQVNAKKSGPQRQNALKERNSDRQPENSTVQNSLIQEPQEPPLAQGMELITYPFPLANGQTARLSLPFFLSKDEASRLAAFINSIAMPEQHTRTDQ